ncbi:MAG TPA: type VI secretion system baseplate subunit TssE [Blastocatellia bacterium]|nr:type VI secretion system baseplate subunit TssE [Blastocatellia bacterium]
MPRTDNEIRITPSVLDRLIDYEPEISREPPASRSKSLRQLKQSVKRDLEWLLNTRLAPGFLPPDLEEVNHSLAAYGLTEFTSFNVKTQADQSRLRRTLEGVIGTFEPRLEEVNVTLLPMQQGQSAVHFRVDARLRIEPAPEPITFDTALQIDNGEYVVKEG